MTEARPVRPGPRRTLSEQVILDAALALLAELGADRVTIRGIAARAGIAPNAVYTYFPDKAAVLHGLAEQLLGRVHDKQAADSALPWRDRVHTVARDLRNELLAHPGSVHLLLGNSLDGQNARAIGAAMLVILADAGLAPDAAARAAHLFNVYLLGSVALETTDQVRATDQFLWGLDRLLDGLVPCAVTPRDHPGSG
ncbi:TetR/AcrR family transcriptional regulator [Actinophytocola glycyrrhizae]|uniref:TetR/AcrR family transcriptional regulator n=1 Tax=Actinophytocola glycyrrhizae TaxID=2044873 RepID=A0ABV9S7T9_9PSEU